MNSLLTILFLFLSMISFGQTKHVEQDLVQENAHKFLKYIINENYEEAKKISTKETVSLIDQMKMVTSLIPDSLKTEWDEARDKARKASYTFSNFLFNSETNATRCTITFSVSLTPHKKEKMILQKVDSKWLIDLSTSLNLSEPDIEHDLNID